MSLNTNKKGPVFDPGTCRCCGASKKCRLLNVEYEHGDKKEVYSDMFVECFGLLLSHMEGEASDRLICGMCVSRLREASAFRRQVLLCEERLLTDRIHVFKEGNLQYGPPPMEIKTELIVKEEDEEEATHCDDGEVDDSEIGTKITQPKEAPIDVVTTQLQSKRSADEHLRAKRQLQLRIQRTKERMLRIQRAKNLKQLKQQKQQKTKKTYTIPPNERFIDEDSLAFKNNVALVEFSYSCPFQTTYSSYACIYCRESFADPVKLREHNLKHDPREFKHAMQESKKPTYLDIERIDCRLCNRKIDKMEEFKTHLQEHGKILHNVRDEILKFKLSVGPISCTECESSFIFFHALKRHMAVHFGSFVCDICAAHYFDKRTLEKHTQSAHRGDELYASCHECGKVFKSKHSLYLHTSAVHKKEAAFQCSRCDANLFSCRDRYKHMLEEHGEAISYPCETCGKVYANRKNLREHTRTVHLGIHKYRCAACARGFAQPQRLSEHVMAMHRNERSFHCDTCGNSYPRLHYLRLHMQSHAPSEPCG